jgi:predicted dehydrogenase
MAETLKVGLIGLDTSHVIAFTNLLNDSKNEHHVPGTKVVVGYPGGSKDFDLSINRVEGFTKDLREKHGLQIVDSPEKVAEMADIVIINSVDGRVHLEQFKQTIKYKKPTFIDKPFTNDYAEAKEIMRLAEEAGVPVMSSSSLRYADELVRVMNEAKSDPKKRIVGIDCVGPLEIRPPVPGYFWYGVHAVETVVAALGAGCKHVQVFVNTGTDLATLVWGDGRVATIRGNRAGHKKFAAVVHREEDYVFLDMSKGKPGYAGLLQAAIPALAKGKSAIDPKETLEVVRIMEALNESRDSGKVVQI